MENASPGEIYASISDPANRPQWDLQMIEGSLTDNELASIYKNHREVSKLHSFQFNKTSYIFEDVTVIDSDINYCECKFNKAWIIEEIND